MNKELEEIKKELISYLQSLHDKTFDFYPTGELVPIQRNIFNEMKFINKGSFIEEVRYIYLVNKEQLDVLLDIQAKADSLSIDDSKNPLKDLISFKNPANPAWSIANEIKQKKKSSTVTNKTLIMERLPGKFAAYKNIERDKLNKQLLEGSINNETHARDMDRLNKELDEVEAKVKNILENPQDFKIRFATYERYEYYAYLYLNYYKAKENFPEPSESVFLREDVANIIYYIQDLNRNDNFKPSASVLRFIKEASHLFSDVYVKENK